MPSPANRPTVKQRLLGAASSFRAITNARDANFAAVHEPFGAKQVRSLAVVRHRAGPVDRGQPTQLGELENSPQGQGLSIPEILDGFPRPESPGTGLSKSATFHHEPRETAAGGASQVFREVHRPFVAALGHAPPDLSTQEIDARSYSVTGLVLPVFGGLEETRAPHAKSNRLLGRKASLQSRLEFSTAGIQGSPSPQMNS